ncbi:MAG: hypothetical protein R8G66_05505 [Cytophagales bacterium]|nr:hypothetical protein [Cytophagales bacterium]
MRNRTNKSGRVAKLEGEIAMLRNNASREYYAYDWQQLVNKSKKLNKELEKLLDEERMEKFLEKGHESILANWSDRGMELSNRIKTKKKAYIRSLAYILPKTVRLEYLADIHDIKQDMKEQGLKNWWINMILFLNFTSVVYHAYKFKLSGYFYRMPTAEEEKEKARNN